MSDKRVATIYDYVRFKKEVCHKTTCNKCPLSRVNNGMGGDCIEFLNGETDKANEIILKWCDEHLKKTRQSELLKIFPKTKMTDGVLNVCPITFNEGCDNEAFGSEIECDDCRKKFWLEEIE